MDVSGTATSLQNDTRTIYPISWNEFAELTHQISACIQADGACDVIVGIQRGGLIPAVNLSHYLGVRPFLSLPVSRTTSDEVFADKITPFLTPIQPDLLKEYITNKDVLVVDDIAGTGASIQHVLHFLAAFAPVRLRSAIWVVNRENWDGVNPHPPTATLTYVGKEVYGWVVFPWENAAFL